MKKIIAIILAVMLMVSLAVTASAANIVPIGKLNFKMPTIKTVDVSYSTVYESAKVAIIKNLYKIPLN